MGDSSLPKATLRDATLALAGTIVIGTIAAGGGLDYPAAWPDEVLFAAPARALLESGRLATEPLAGLLPGAERATYWMPPLYFLVLSGWFALAGASLWTMRLLSLAAASGTMFLVLRLQRIDGRLPLWPSALLLALIALDPLFVRGALVGRMDMLALCLTCAAVRCASVHDRRRADVGCGVLAGLAVLAHPLGVAAPAGIMAARLWDGARERRAGSVSLLLAGIAAAVAPWIAWVVADAPTFAAQMGQQFARKAADDLPSRLAAFVAFLDPAPAGQILRLALLGIGLVALVEAARRVKALRPAAATAVFFALAAIWSGEMWYPMYLVPFAALGLVRLVEHPRRHALIPAAVLVGVALVWAAGRDAQALASARHRDYARWSIAVDAAVLGRAPAGTRVLVNSIPDPAALLIHRRPEIAWRQFSPVPIADAEYDAFLEAIDVFILGPTAPDVRVLAWLDARRAGWPATRVEAGGLTARVIARPGLW